VRFSTIGYPAAMTSPITVLPYGRPDCLQSTREYQSVRKSTCGCEYTGKLSTRNLRNS